MSRNKDIYALHVITGNSYKECHNRMKADFWNLYIALGNQADWVAIAKVLKDVKDVAECIVKTITEAAKQLQQTLSDLEPAEIRRILAEAESEVQDEQRNNHIQVP